MSKPQVASEPTLEEILTSIRKMISDDRVAPNPMPDQMGRTPFGEQRASSTLSEFEVRGAGEPAGATRGAGKPNFNSLSDALKVATALSDQRRSLQQDIADAVDKSPRSNLDALAKVSADRVGGARGLADGRSGGASDAASPVLPTSPARPSATSPAEGKRDLLSFDFGAVVPQREDARGAAPAVEPKPSVTGLASTAPPKPAAAGLGGAAAPTGESPAAKNEAKAEQPAEPRVLQLRAGLNASGGQGAGFNVAPFPRPVRETAKSTEIDTPATSDKIAPAEASKAPAAAEPTAALTVSAKDVSDAPAAAHSEALLDAVVELVQQEPAAFSVFTSGASFIGGVAGKKQGGETLPALTEASEVAPVPVGAGKLDRTAAELLRPMMRQWLAENMERILEEALRSELSEKTQSGKEPGKS